jgi:hypothetical protein
MFLVTEVSCFCKRASFVGGYHASSTAWLSMPLMSSMVKVQTNCPCERIPSLVLPETGVDSD